MTYQLTFYRWLREPEITMKVEADAPEDAIASVDEHFPWAYEFIDEETGAFVWSRVCGAHLHYVAIQNLDAGAWAEVA